MLIATAHAAETCNSGCTAIVSVVLARVLTWALTLLLCGASVSRGALVVCHSGHPAKTDANHAAPLNFAWSGHLPAACEGHGRFAAAPVPDRCSCGDHHHDEALLDLLFRGPAPADALPVAEVGATAWVPWPPALNVPVLTGAAIMPPCRGPPPAPTWQERVASVILRI